MAEPWFRDQRAPQVSGSPGDYWAMSLHAQTWVESARDQALWDAEVGCVLGSAPTLSPGARAVLREVLVSLAADATIGADGRRDVETMLEAVGGRQAAGTDGAPRASGRAEAAVLSPPLRAAGAARRAYLPLLRRIASNAA